MRQLAFAIPQYWRIESIPKLLFFQEGPGVRKWQFKDKGVKLLNVGNINNGKINLAKTSIYIAETEAYGKYSHFLVDEGDLVCASSGVVVNNFHNKIAFIEGKDMPLCMNTSTIRFKTLDKNVLNIEYFKLFLCTNIFKSQLKKLITGSAQLNFGPSHLKKIKVIFPPIDDQIHIATLLSRVEALTNTRKENLRLLDDFLKSTFLEMFGDPVRNEKQWKPSTIEQLCTAIVDCPHSTPEYSDINTGFYCIRSSDIVDGLLNLKQTRYVSEKTYMQRIARYEPSFDDVVFTREGGRLGNAALIPKNKLICLGQRIMLFKVNPIVCSSQFLWAVLESESFKKKVLTLVGGGAAPRVNIKDIKKLTLYLPTIENQNKFTAIVKKVESIKSQYQQNLTELENLYGALSQKAFKGELDLSRIPLPNTMEGTVIEPIVEVTAEIEQAEYSIPNPETRQTLLRKLFDTFTLEQKNKAFLLDDFWQYAETNSQQYMDEDSPALGLLDYEQAKQWLFDLIENGQIEQQFIDDSKQIKLKVKG